MTAHRTSNPGESPPNSLLSRRLSLLGRLAGSLAHEIRNPLNAVYLHLDIISEEMRQFRHEDRSQMEQSLTTIRGEVTRLHDLMQGYLALARLTDGAREPEDMRTVVETVARDAREALAAKAIVLHLEGMNDLGEMTIHKPTLSRAVLSVVLHAASLLPQGSDLAICGRRTSSHLHLTLHAPGKSPPAQTQIPEEARLRLSVVEEILAAHGGRFEGQENDAGIICRLTLPLHSAAHPDLLAPEA